MSVSLLIHIPADGDARSGAEELVRFLAEEAEGLFSSLRFDAQHVDRWQAWLDEYAPEIVPIVEGAPSAFEIAEAEQLGLAFVRSFASEYAGEAIGAIADTSRSKYRSARSSPAATGASSVLHDALADPVLPEAQRRSMIRCMYGVLIATAGTFELPLFEFAGPEAEGTNASDRKLRSIATEIATPDTLRFKIWNDCLELLRVRSRTVALGAASTESVIPSPANSIAILRGASSDTPVLVLANPTSDVSEVAIDRRPLPENVGPTFREEITGDTLFVPDGGDNLLSIDLEPYEVMWLSLT